MLFLLNEQRWIKQKLILFSVRLTPKLLEKSDPFKDIFNFIADLSKTFPKSLLLYPIYLLRMLVFTLIEDCMKAFNEFFCFQDGYSKYIQVPIALEDKKKTTFICPLGTYAFRWMSFGLCNAPSTFQRCRMTICFLTLSPKLWKSLWMILVFTVILLMSACMVSQ